MFSYFLKYLSNKQSIVTDTCNVKNDIIDENINNNNKVEYRQSRSLHKSKPKKRNSSVRRLTYYDMLVMFYKNRAKKYIKWLLNKYNNL